MAAAITNLCDVALFFRFLVSIGRIQVWLLTKSFGGF
jgi:hypothetical protein